MSSSINSTPSIPNDNAEKDIINPMALLAQSLTNIEASDSETFALLSSFDMSEPRSYEAAMSGLHASE